ncbi:MAG: SAM-dependent methyltransferase [Planctomycetota bacterium]|nr:MAG: SAM-dependent methyltransferase [Planctomycetota bacterium]
MTDREAGFSKIADVRRLFAEVDCDDGYALLDFGHGRRLERFGPFVLDRPAPAAKAPRLRPEIWDRADAYFDRGPRKTGKWLFARELPERWIVRLGPCRFELKLTEFGHVGMFPEQLPNWRRLTHAVRRCVEAKGTCRVLNLFAYTGGSTMACAAAGAEVVHIDAARNVVEWARRNAEHAGLADRPVRWIAEDAWKFVRRENKRGNRYDGIILDPPSYGHGPRGEVFRAKQHLDRLLEAAAALLTDEGPVFVLLTCHTPEFDTARLRACMTAAIRSSHGSSDAGKTTAGAMTIPLSDDADGSLPAGNMVMWMRPGTSAR